METKLLSTDRPIAIYYAFITNVVSYGKIGKSKCQVVLDGNWNEINTTIGTIKFKELPGTSKAGTLFTSTLNATIPGEDENSPENTANLSGRKALIKIEYKSGRQRIIGSYNSGPRLLVGTDSDISTKRNLSASFENTEPSRWLE